MVGWVTDRALVYSGNSSKLVQIRGVVVVEEEVVVVVVVVEVVVVEVEVEVVVVLSLLLLLLFVDYLLFYYFRPTVYQHFVSYNIRLQN